MRHFPFALVLALAGCGASSDPGNTNVGTPADDQGSEKRTPITSEPGASPGSGSTDPSGPEPSFGCRLPAPVVSEDVCKQDADCAPSTPCHARACVATSKATPRTPDSVCTMNIDCQSADVNPCSCYQGHCALVPKNP